MLVRISVVGTSSTYRDRRGGLSAFRVRSWKVGGETVAGRAGAGEVDSRSLPRAGIVAEELIERRIEGRGLVEAFHVVDFDGEFRRA